MVIHPVAIPPVLVNKWVLILYVEPTMLYITPLATPAVLLRLTLLWLVFELPNIAFIQSHDYIQNLIIVIMISILPFRFYLYFWKL